MSGTKTNGGRNRGEDEKREWYIIRGCNFSTNLLNMYKLKRVVGTMGKSKMQTKTPPHTSSTLIQTTTTQTKMHQATHTIVQINVD